MGNASAASGYAVYVNGSSGSDSNDGSSWLLAKKTIKNATETVETDGTINIAKGRYSGIKNTEIIIHKNITFNGESQKTTIINGNGTNWIFIISSDALVTLNNLTLANTTANNGGAIYNNGSLTVKDSNFINNSADNFGGAIYNEAYLKLTCNNFTGNTADYYGGAIFSGENGYLMVSYTNFTSNTALLYDGGAIYNYEGAYLTVDSCNFTNNKVGGGGGAIQNYGGNCDINDSIFHNNNAAIWGGSISNSDGSCPYIGVLTVYGSTFTDCTSYYGYGTIYNSGSKCSIVGNNIMGNIGYAIYTVNSNTQINFNRILNNSNNQDIWGVGGIDANNNWWGTNFLGTSPVAGGRVNNNVAVDSWLVLNITANPITMGKNGKSTITANLLKDNHGKSVDGYLPDGTPIYFTTTIGTIDSKYLKTVNSIAYTSLNGGVKDGVATVSATLDNQTMTTRLIMDFTSPKVISNPSGGLYNSTKLVSLKMNEVGTIYYTINGATPTTSSMKYTGPITIKFTTTLKYLAVDLVGNISPVYSNTYNIDKSHPKPLKMTPLNNTINVSLTAPITIKFSENITKGENFRNIYIKNLTTGKIAKTTVTSINGKTLTLKMTKSRLSLNKYEVIIPKSAVKDTVGNKNSKYVLYFKTSKY
jgi:predicted outer membrane repeat protein